MYLLIFIFRKLVQSEISGNHRWRHRMAIMAMAITFLTALWPPMALAIAPFAIGLAKNCRSTN